MQFYRKETIHWKKYIAMIGNTLTLFDIFQTLFLNKVV